MSPPGRPKGEYRSAQHEGTPVSAAPGPGEPAWFSALGAPLADAQRVAIDAIVAAGGTPAGGIVVVPDWSALAASLRLAEHDDQWWNREEDEREALWGLATLRHTEDALESAIAGAVDAARGPIARAIEAAMARAGTGDAALGAAGRAAALLCVHQHALAVAAGAASGHLFCRKQALFAAGRWPIGVVAGRFHVF